MSAADSASRSTAVELIELLELSSLEKYTLSTCREDSSDRLRRKAFTAYLALREKICADFLPMINSSIPYINDHTRTHIERVRSHVEKALELHFPIPRSEIQDIPGDRVITWADAMILLNALVWHDIGNIYGRTNHAAMVYECFEDISGQLYDSNIADYVKQVARAHSGPRAIGQLIPDSDAVQTYRGEEIHLQFLAAVLRFADELDEDNRRVQPPNWRDIEDEDGAPRVPLESQRFWFFSESNSSISIRNGTGSLNIVPEVIITSRVAKSQFDQPFVYQRGEQGQPDKEIDALTEYFRRIFKIEHERRYCDSFLRRAYYHRGVSAVRVKLHSHEAGQPPNSGAVYDFALSDSTLPADLASDSKLADIHPYINRAIALSSE